MASRSLSPLSSSTKCYGRACERKMATTSLSSSPSKATTAKLGGISSSSSSYTQLTFCSRHSFQKAATTTAFHKPQPELLLLSPARNKHARTYPATDNDQVAPPPAAPETTTPSPPTAPNDNDQQPQPSTSGQAPSEPPKRAPLTAQERLRAARVLGSPKKPDFRRRVLDVLREMDGGGKRACWNSTH